MWPEGGAAVEGSWISQVLPDGVHALAHTSSDGGVSFETFAVNLESGSTRSLTAGGWPRYAPSGHLIFLSNDGTLIATPFDIDRAEIVGSPVPLQLASTVTWTSLRL